MGTFSQPSNQIDPGFGMNTSSQPSQGKGSTTMSATSGQPQFGAPNQYPNTIQQNNGRWDNATIGNQAMGQSHGKGGKGQSSWQPFNQPWNPPGQ